jgi:hypothetical protein
VAGERRVPPSSFHRLARMDRPPWVANPEGWRGSEALTTPGTSSRPPLTPQSRSREASTSTEPGAWASAARRMRPQTSPTAPRQPRRRPAEQTCFQAAKGLDPDDSPDTVCAREADRRRLQHDDRIAPDHRAPLLASRSRSLARPRMAPRKPDSLAQTRAPGPRPAACLRRTRNRRQIRPATLFPNERRAVATIPSLIRLLARLMRGRPQAVLRVKAVVFAWPARPPQCR